MATTVAVLEAKLTADTRDFDRGMDRSQGKMRGAAKIAGIAGAAIGGILVAGSIKAIQAASDLNEEIDKSTVVFGKASREVLKWSGGTASSLGLSQRMALQAAGAYGNMFKTIGLGDKPAADMSMRMVKLAADMASFSNQDPSDMLLRLRGGLAGEAEPLRQFGILLSEAAVKTQAYKMGLAAVGGELTEQEKVQARYALILEQSALQHGNFELTSKSLANQERILRAQIEDLSAKLGAVLIPIMQKVIAHVISLTEWFGKHQTAAKILVAAIGALAAALLAAAAAQLLMNLAVLANPYVATAVAVGILSAALVILWQRSDRARDIMVAISPVFGQAAQSATILAKHYDTLSDTVQRLWSWLGKVKDIFEWIIDNAKKIGGALGGITGAVGKIIPGGDPKNPFLAPPGAGTGPADISPKLYDELAGARMFGLALTSGYRPGAITRSGHPSDHGIYPSHAIDVAGSPSRMASFFRWLIGQRDVKQAFYDPLGSIFGGMLSSYREGGHSGHVHVATYHKGGVVRGPVGDEVPILAQAGEAILPIGWQKTWQQKTLEFMQRIWGFASYYFGSPGGMPAVDFLTREEAGDMGAYTLVDHPLGSGNWLGRGARKVMWPEQVSNALFRIKDDSIRGTISQLEQWALNTLIHEWVHAFQNVSTLKDDWKAEGGAVNFVRMLGDLIYGKAGVNYTGFNSGGLYEGYAARVMEKLGPGWVRRGQFGIYDQGGWLPPGLSMAYNGTGRPEPVGGGGTYILNAPNYVGPKEELFTAWREMNEKFKRRNGG